MSLIGRKILIVVENLPVPFDRRVWREARTLRDAGATVTVICPTGKGMRTGVETLEGIEIIRHPLPAERNSTLGFVWEYLVALVWESWLAWRTYFRKGFDTIQGCNPPDLIFLVALQFRLLGVKFIFDHHDLSPELFESKFGRRGLLWRLLTFVEWATFQTASVVISTNNSYREVALTRGRKPSEKIFVVRSGPDVAKLVPVAPNPAWREGRAFLVGYVGVMGKQEGIDQLLRAIAHLVHLGRSDIKFVIAGDGPEREALVEMASTLGVAAYVNFPGRLPDGALFELLSTADVCVNPDTVNPMNDKSTMNKIMEYMCFGKPIVQYEQTEGRVSAGEASLYAKPNDYRDFADKILQLLEDPSLRQAMGSQGRDRVISKLAWEYEAPKLIAAYEAVS